MTLNRRVNSALNISKGRELAATSSKRQINGIEFYHDPSVETGRQNKIAQRAAPKGLLLKQRKLFIAAKSNNFNMILTSGFNYFESDTNIKDDKGNSPLYYAAKNGDKQMCDFLVRHQAFVNEPCSEGNTPLHMAFASGQVMVLIIIFPFFNNITRLSSFLFQMEETLIFSMNMVRHQ